MASPRQLGSIAFLTVSGIASAAVSLFGVFTGLWGGSKSPYPVLFSFFWILPALSLPAFGIYFLSGRLGRLCQVLLVVGIYATLFLLSWKDCMAGQCNTNSMARIALGPFTWVNHLWGQVIASLFLSFASWKGQQVRS